MAHLLTGLRLLAVAPAAWAFSRPDRSSAWLLVVLVAIAIATDLLDGVVARRSGAASARGMLFDHTTDFLFVTGGLAGASVAGLVPTLLPVLIVVAFSQYVLDSYLPASTAAAPHELPRPLERHSLLRAPGDDHHRRLASARA